MAVKEFGLKRYRNIFLWAVVLVVLIQLCNIACNTNLPDFLDGLAKGVSFFGHLFPPDWPAFADLLQPAFESLLLAILGTIFGAVLSLFFALPAAKNLAPLWLRNIARALISIERAVPELFILLLLVAALGLGAMAGVICLAIGCVGMLGKLVGDTIEEIDTTLMQSLESTGANKLQIIAYGVFPEIWPNIISAALFRLEINIRLSVIIGAVGAGGIGYELQYAFNMLQYHRAFTALIIVFALVFGVEQLSSLLRNKIKNQAVLK